MENYTEVQTDFFWSNDFESYSAKDVREYLDKEDNFRSFAAGIRELMQRHGYTGPADDHAAAVRFLMEHYLAIPYFASRPKAKNAALRKSLQNWLKENTRPEVLENSRERVFELFFALQCTMDEINWFLAHVFFARPFYCRSMRDAVYFFSFYHGYTYEHCWQLLAQVGDIQPEPAAGVTINTQAVRKKLEHIRCDDDQELLRFLQANGGSFTSWEKKAYPVLRELVSLIRGREGDRAMLEKYLKDKNDEKLRCAPYVIQEYASLHHTGQFEFTNVRLDSIDFMLEMILAQEETSKKQFSFSESLKISKLITNNFPDRNGFNAIINGTATSYELIRKTIILLQFYACAFMEEEENAAVPEEGHYDYYMTKINMALTEAGLDTLFFGNPYDMVFMLAARSSEPLGEFRELLSMAYGWYEEE